MAGTPLDLTQYVLDARETLGAKFSPQDVLDNPLLLAAATEYAKNYTGNFAYMVDMKHAVARWKKLSERQAAGTLNCMVADANFRAKLAEKATEVDAAGALIQAVPNGTYTVVFDGDMTNYVTLRIKDDFRDDAPAGAQMIQFLSGPDNSTSFTGFGFVVGSDVRVWSKFKHDTRIHDAARLLLGSDSDALGYSRETYAEKSGRCSNCGKKLTVPVSLHRGLGPDCAKMLGVA